MNRQEWKLIGYLLMFIKILLLLTVALTLGLDAIKLILGQ